MNSCSLVDEHLSSNSNLGVGLFLSLLLWGWAKQGLKLKRHIFFLQHLCWRNTSASASASETQDKEIIADRREFLVTSESDFRLFHPTIAVMCRNDTCNFPGGCGAAFCKTKIRAQSWRMAGSNPGMTTRWSTFCCVELFSYLLATRGYSEQRLFGERARTR